MFEESVKMNIEFANKKIKKEKLGMKRRE